MRKFLAVAAAPRVAIGARNRRRRPSCSSSSRSTNSPPTCSTNIARNSPAGSRGSRRAWRIATAIRATPTTETCPGHSTILTGDHPARTGHHLNAWVDQSTPRADKTVYCAEDESAPGSTSIHYKVSPASSARADARRADEAQVARKPQCRGLGQGPLRGHDERPRRRPALVLDRQQVRDGPCRRGAAGSRCANQCGGRRGDRRAHAGARSAAVLRGQGPGRFRSKAAASRSAPAVRAGGGRFVGVPRFPRLDAAVLALSAALIQDMQLGAHAAPDIISVGLVGDRLCRPHLRHRRPGDVPSAALARPRPRRLSCGARPQDRLCGCADRRSWRAGHSRARCACTELPMPRGSTPR